MVARAPFFNGSIFYLFFNYAHIFWFTNIVVFYAFVIGFYKYEAVYKVLKNGDEINFTF